MHGSDGRVTVVDAACVSPPDYALTQTLVRYCLPEGYKRITIDHKGYEVYAWPPINRPLNRVYEPLWCVPLWHHGVVLLNPAPSIQKTTRGDHLSLRSPLVMGVYEEVPDWSEDFIQAELVRRKMLEPGHYDPITCPHGGVLRNVRDISKIEGLVLCREGCFENWNR